MRSVSVAVPVVCFADYGAVLVDDADALSQAGQTPVTLCSMVEGARPPTASASAALKAKAIEVSRCLGNRASQKRRWLLS